MFRMPRKLALRGSSVFLVALALAFGFSMFRRYENADAELDLAKALVNREESVLEHYYSSNVQKVSHDDFEPDIRNEINLSYRPKMTATSADKVYIVKVRARILVFFVKGNRIVDLWTGLT